MLPLEGGCWTISHCVLYLVWATYCIVCNFSPHGLGPLHNIRVVSYIYDWHSNTREMSGVPRFTSLPSFDLGMVSEPENSPADL